MDRLLINKSISIKDAMKQMNAAGGKTLFVTDSEKRLLGSLTDGDIRRWILKEGSLSESIDKVYNRKPVSTRNGYDIMEIKRLMLGNKVEGIPVLNDREEILDVLLWGDIFGKERVPRKTKIDIPVVIMAGGKGTRLDPFTRILPKPLIPIGDKAIIEIIMDKFADHGINRFYVSINTKAHMIKSYFKEMNTRYSISYIEEEEPLGTAGSLKLLRDRIEKEILVSNCDIIVDCDYAEVADFHRKNAYDITIVGSYRHFTIPYGICEIEKNGLLKDLKEKPEYDFLVNTGMTVLGRKALELIPANEKFDITDLIARVRGKRGKVGVFPINEKSWIDVGHWEEYHKSVKLLGIE